MIRTIIVSKLIATGNAFTKYYHFWCCYYYTIITQLFQIKKNYTKKDDN